MPMFELSPVPSMRWHAAWAPGTVYDSCVVSAEDEGHARRLAARFFGPSPTAEVAGEPWSRADLVLARQLRKQEDGPEPPLGMVIPMLPLQLE